MFRNKQHFTTEYDVSLQQTKLVDILEDFELNDINNSLKVVEEAEKGSLTLIRTKDNQPSKTKQLLKSKLPNWQITPYDLGGHSPYFNSQRLFSSQTSFFFLVFQRYKFLWPVIPYSLFMLDNLYSFFIRDGFLVDEFLPKIGVHLENILK